MEPANMKNPNMKNMKKFLFLILSLIWSTAFAADPKIKTALPKTILKTNESFSLSYYLTNSKNRKISGLSGTVSVKKYTDSSCSQNESQIGSSFDLGASSSANYLFSTSGFEGGSLTIFKGEKIQLILCSSFV